MPIHPLVTLSEKDELDILAVLRILKQVVAEAGDDYIYQPNADGSCQYVRLNTPSCLAGRVLHRLGVSLEVLRAWEGEGCDMMWGTSGDRRPSIDFTPISLAVLRQAQVVQDRGQPWGDARDAALLFAFQHYGVSGA